MSEWLILADGGSSGLTEALLGIAWMFGAGAILVGILALMVIGTRRLLGKE